MLTGMESSSGLLVVNAGWSPIKTLSLVTSSLLKASRAAPSVFRVPPPSPCLMFAEATGNIPVNIESLPSPGMYPKAAASESPIFFYSASFFF